MKVFGISAPMTGSGKTTVTLGLLKKLKNSISFKIGPDYIDGQFHTAITGKTTASIDRWLQGRNYKRVIPRFASGNDYGIVEGVMGLHDAGSQANLSTADYFEKLNIPYILVVEISRMAESAYYVAKGFLGKKCLGVILNNYHSEKHLEMVRREFLNHNVHILGTIPHESGLSFPERHLGLNLEVDRDRVNAVAESVARNLDISFTDRLPEIPMGEASEPAVHRGSANIFVARDAAFSFYYETSLQALERIGNLKYFSPLRDEVPEDPGLIYFGGGYPELFAKELSMAKKCRMGIREYSRSGVPIIAECGGLMYLEKRIRTKEGDVELVGAFPGTVKRNSKLTLNYTKLKAREDSLFFRSGDILYGHEFHYSSIEDSSSKKLVNIIGKGISGEDGMQVANTFGSYSHFDLERYGKRLEASVLKYTQK